MIAQLLPQLKDRIRDIEADRMSGAEKKTEQDRFQKLVDGLKERVEGLKDATGKEEREQYLQKVEETFEKFKSAKPAKEESSEKPEAPKPEPQPAPEPVKKEDPKKKDKSPA